MDKSNNNLWYFKGTFQNGEEIFIFLSKNLKIECSNGFSKDMNYTLWVEADKHVATYLHLILELKEAPSRISPNVFFREQEERRKAIRDKVKECENKKALYKYKNYLNREEVRRCNINSNEYVLCEYCAEEINNKVLIKINDYESHLVHDHKIVKHDLSNVDLVSSKLADKAERLIVLELLINTIQQENREINIEYEAAARKNIKHWQSNTKVLEQKINNLIILKSSLENKCKEYQKEKREMVNLISHYKIDIEKSENFIELSRKRNVAKEDFDKLTAKYNLAISERENALKSNKLLQAERDNLKTKLENVQKYIKNKNILNVSSSYRKDNVTQSPEEQSLISGVDHDGSKGFHERRENGRFGSLSSFDNYGDDYNEKDDSQIDIYHQ